MSFLSDGSGKSIQRAWQSQIPQANPTRPQALWPGAQALEQLRRRIGIGGQTQCKLSGLYPGTACPAQFAVSLALQIVALDQELLKFDILLALQRRNRSTAARHRPSSVEPRRQISDGSRVDQGLVPSQKGPEILVSEERGSGVPH